MYKKREKREVSFNPSDPDELDILQYTDQEGINFSGMTKRLWLHYLKGYPLPGAPITMPVRQQQATGFVPVAPPVNQVQAPELEPVEVVERPKPKRKPKPKPAKPKPEPTPEPIEETEPEQIQEPEPRPKPEPVKSRKQEEDDGDDFDIGIPMV